MKTELYGQTGSCPRQFDGRKKLDRTFNTIYKCVQATNFCQTN